MKTLPLLMIGMTIAGPSVSAKTAADQAIPLSEFFAAKKASGGMGPYKWERNDIYARTADGKLEYVGSVEGGTPPRGLAWLGEDTGLVNSTMAISKDGRSIVFRHWSAKAPKPGSKMEDGIYRYVQGEGLKLLEEAAELGQAYTRWEKPIPSDVLPFKYRFTGTSADLVWARTATGEKLPLGLYGGGPLHWAAFEGRTEDCVNLRKEGADLDAGTYWGFTPLDLAIIRNHESTAIRLFELGARAGEGGLPPFHRAAMLGRLDVVRAMLDGGVSPNAVDSHGDTALHMAAVVLSRISGQQAIFFMNAETPGSLLDRKVTVPLIQLLLDRGADPNIRNQSGETPLAVLSPGAPEEARALLAKATTP